LTKIIKSLQKVVVVLRVVDKTDRLQRAGYSLVLGKWLGRSANFCIAHTKPCSGFHRWFLYEEGL